MIELLGKRAMLFLLNNQIVSIDTPEHHLGRRWQVMGCGDPHGLRAREALDYASAVLGQLQREDVQPDQELIEDIAALIIAKTGANALLFSQSSGTPEPRLTMLPEAILEQLQARLVAGETFNIGEVWPLAA